MPKHLKSPNCNFKKIMIFGAGINQIELIKAARELNSISIVLDPSPSPPGKSFADYFYQVEGKDYELTKEIANKHKINGIVTGQMEKPMRLMAKLALELKLCFHTPEIVEQSLDKWLMKQAFLSHSVPCAGGIRLRTEEKLTNAMFTQFSFPMIIKPRDAYSSRGVYKISSTEELFQHLEETRSFSESGDILIEEFLEGREFSIETITWNNTTSIIQFTEKFITPYPNTVEIAHLQPAEFNAKEKNLISSVVKAGINALQINNSAAHAEVMLTKNGPKIIEIGARLGGDFISSYLTKASTGISMDKAAVSIALGLSPDLKVKKEKYAIIKYLELPIGKTIKTILSLEDLSGLPGFIFAWVFVKPGDTILPVTHSGMRPACIIIEADSRRSLLSRAQQAVKALETKIIL